MRRVLGTVLAVVLLLVLGALAVLALPNPNASLASAPAVSPAAPEYNPEVVTGPAFNMIAMPLDARKQFQAAGYQFDAEGLLKLAGTGVVQVGRWNAAAKRYETLGIDPDSGNPVGTPFSLEVGGAYWLVLESTASQIISFVGDVPSKNSVHFNLVTGNPCAFNELSIPLDQSIADAAHLYSATGAQQVSHWLAADRRYESFSIDPDSGNPVGNNFTTQIGYPYVVCLLTGAPTVWPPLP